MTIVDPACGSGRLLVEAAKRQPDAVYVGVDKDVTCVKMTALNLCLFNVDGYAVHGDSLTQEYHGAWQTTYSPLGGSVRELDEAAVPDFEISGADTADTQVDIQQASFEDFSD